MHTLSTTGLGGPGPDPEGLFLCSYDTDAASAASHGLAGDQDVGRGNNFFPHCFLIPFLLAYIFWIKGGLLDVEQEHQIWKRSILLKSDPVSSCSMPTNIPC